MNVEKWKKNNPARNCPDCDVEPNTTHVSGCDVERCSVCNGQQISCGCYTESMEELPSRLLVLCTQWCKENDISPDEFVSDPEDCAQQVRDLLDELDKHDSEKVKWTGWWPGDLECVARDWFSYMPGTGTGWHRCHPDHPEATPDLNRWSMEGCPE